MAVAGCTGTSSPAVTTTPGGQATATPPAGTTTPGGSSTGMLSSLYQAGKYTWYEYKMASSFGDFNVKSEYSTASYGGVPNAKYLKYTMVMGKGTPQEMTTIYDLYYNGDTFLGGHMKMVSGGQTLSDQDIKAGDSTYSKMDPGNSISSSGGNVALVNAGADTVTVPAGTYACTKYTVSSGDYRGAYWVAPNVPMPVKMVMTDSKGEVTGSMELVGWG
jgi:hypothetical protein